jgi:hypothetical protein
MKKPREEDIPKSVLTGYNSYGADLSYLNGKGKMLFLNPKCVVIGLENLPYTVFLTHEFDFNNLPQEIRKDIYEAKQLILQPIFSSKNPKSAKFCVIPESILNFKNIHFLRLSYVELDDLDILKDLPIEHLILENVKFDDSDNLIISITQFNSLKEISHDKSLTNYVIDSINEWKSDLILTPISK